MERTGVLSVVVIGGVIRCVGEDIDVKLVCVVEEMHVAASTVDVRSIVELLVAWEPSLTLLASL